MTYQHPHVARCSRFPIEKLIFCVKSPPPTFHVTWMFVTMFKRTCKLHILGHYNPVRTLQFSSFRSILILFWHLPVSLLSDVSFRHGLLRAIWPNNAPPQFGHSNKNWKMSTNHETLYYVMFYNHFFLPPCRVQEFCSRPCYRKPTASTFIS